VCALLHSEIDVAGFLKPCMKPHPPHLDLLSLVHEIHTAVLAVHLQTRDLESISRSSNANARVVLTNSWRSDTWIWLSQLLEASTKQTVINGPCSKNKEK
jgi:hypothetical protein